MSAVETICKAIEERHVLFFVYNDQRRMAEPYILGYDDKDALVLSAVQLSGGSGQGFRSFHVDGLSSIEVTAQKFFGAHPGYNPKDPYFARIICLVVKRRR